MRIDTYRKWILRLLIHTLTLVAAESQSAELAREIFDTVSHAVVSPEQLSELREHINRVRTLPVIEISSNGRTQTVYASLLVRGLIGVICPIRASIYRGYGGLVSSMLSHSATREGAQGKLDELARLLLGCPVRYIGPRVGAGCCCLRAHVDDVSSFANGAFDGLLMDDPWIGSFRSLAGHEQHIPIMWVDGDNGNDPLGDVVKSIQISDKRMRKKIARHGMEALDFSARVAANHGLIGSNLAKNFKVVDEKSTQIRLDPHTLTARGARNISLLRSIGHPTKLNDLAVISVKIKFMEYNDVQIRTHLEIDDNSFVLTATVVIPPHVVHDIDEIAQSTLQVFRDFLGSSPLVILAERFGIN
jgi:hypothetical protein